MEKKHRVRRTAATFVGGLGIVFLSVGLVGTSLFGFVSSAETTRKSVESVFDDSSIRQVVAKELVTKIEESGDTPQEKIVFSIAKPLIENAVMKVMGTPALRDFAGDISFTAYEVFVDEKPPTKVDLSPMVEAAMGAIKNVDPRIARQFTPKVDPLELKRDADSPDLKGIRDNVRRGLWVILVLGVVLEALAWFLSTATNLQRLMRLGIRLAIGGILVALSVLTVRGQTFGASAIDAEAVRALTAFMTRSTYAWGIGLFLVGSVVVICCCLKTLSLKKRPLQP